MGRLEGLVEKLRGLPAQIEATVTLETESPASV
jgi:hypothetical protein